MKYNREDILRIGGQIAEKLGASCLNYHINTAGREIIFECQGFGECFEASISFEDLLEKYQIDIAAV